MNMDATAASTLFAWLDRELWLVTARTRLPGGNEARHGRRDAVPGRSGAGPGASVRPAADAEAVAATGPVGEAERVETAAASGRRPRRRGDPGVEECRQGDKETRRQG